MKPGVPVEVLYRENKALWELELLTGLVGLDRMIRVSEVHRPGLAMSGYFHLFPKDRIQVLGKTELDYVRRLPAQRLQSLFRKILSFPIPAVVVSRRLSIPKFLIQEATRQKCPVLQTSLMTTSFIGQLTSYLEDRLAPSISVHGTLMDVFGVGILIMGSSGIGKSECALSLIKRGHRFVGDDVILLRRSAARVITGAHDPVLGYRMEIRGLGIIDIKELFGVASLRNDKQVQVVAILEEWRPRREYDRVGLKEQIHTVLKVPLRKMVIPVRPGRDTALMLEVAAINMRAKEMGISSVQEFDERMRGLFAARQSEAPASPANRGERPQAARAS